MDFTPEEQALLKGYARLLRETTKGVRRRTINADLTDIQTERSAYLKQLEWLTADDYGYFGPIRRIIDKKTPGRMLKIREIQTELENDLSRGFTPEGNLLVPARSIAIDLLKLAKEIDDLLDGRNVPVAFPKPYGLWQAAIIVDGWTEQSGVTERFRTVAEILGDASKSSRKKHKPGVHDPGFLTDPILGLPPDAAIPESLLLAARYAQLAIIHDMCLLAPSTTLITDRLRDDLGKWIDLSWDNLKECERNCDPHVGSQMNEALEKVESDLKAQGLLKTTVEQTPADEDWSQPMTKTRMATALRLRNVYQLNQLIAQGSYVIEKVGNNRQQWKIRLDKLSEDYKQRIKHA